MAGKGFSIQGASETLAASGTETGIEVTAASTRLIKITRLRVAQSTHKTSEQYNFFGQRVTTTGTGTAYTPVLKEPNSGAVGLTAKVLMTAEPTYTANTIYPATRWNSLTGKDIPFFLGQEIWVAPSALWATYCSAPSGTTNTTPNFELEGEEWG